MGSPATAPAAAKLPPPAAAAARALPAPAPPLPPREMVIDMSPLRTQALAPLRAVPTTAPCLRSVSPVTRLPSAIMSTVAAAEVPEGAATGATMGTSGCRADIIGEPAVLLDGELLAPGVPSTAPGVPSDAFVPLAAKSRIACVHMSYSAKVGARSLSSRSADSTANRNTCPLVDWLKCAPAHSSVPDGGWSDFESSSFL